MKLADYLSETKERPADFARRVGVPSSTVTRLLRGERGASLGLALRIEEITHGRVAPVDLGKAGKSPGEVSPSTPAAA